MSDVLQLRFLGVGNANAQALGNASAVLEDGDGRPLLLIDCGPSVLPAYLARYGALPAALFVTHTHLDHIGGLEGLFYRLALEEPGLSLVRLYLPASIVPRLHQQLADDPFKLAEGGMNFWDRFQVIPVGDQFWHAGLLFDVFAVSHHAYRAAFGLGCPGRFVYTGDTRPIPDVLQQFGNHGEWIFHDCALKGSPSHTGVADLAASYAPALCERLVLYHYESPGAADQLRALGYRVADPGEVFRLPPGRSPILRCVG